VVGWEGAVRTGFQATIAFSDVVREGDGAENEGEKGGNGGNLHCGGIGLGDSVGGKDVVILWLDVVC
jgi:hypothetical protein